MDVHFLQVKAYDLIPGGFRSPGKARYQLLRVSVWAGTSIQNADFFAYVIYTSKVYAIPFMSSRR